MSRRRGFTLIEVMVVLSILAITAVLAYNLFGDVLKRAREDQWFNQVHRDMRELAEGYEHYYRKYRAYPGDVEGAALVSAGILKSPKIVPYRKSQGGAWPVTVGAYEFSPTGYNIGGGAANDIYVRVRIVEEAGSWSLENICKPYNGRFSTLSTATYYHTSLGSNITGCLYVAAADDFYIVYPVELDP